MSTVNYNGEMVEIRRGEISKSVNVTNVLGTTPAIDLQGASVMACRSPDSAVGSLTLYASDEIDGTFTEVQDATGVDIVFTLTTNKWLTWLSDTFPHRFIKLVGDASGEIELAGKG